MQDVSFRTRCSPRGRTINLDDLQFNLVGQNPPSTAHPRTSTTPPVFVSLPSHHSGRNTDLQSPTFLTLPSRSTRTSARNRPRSRSRRHGDAMGCGNDDDRYLDQESFIDAIAPSHDFSKIKRDAYRIRTFFVGRGWGVAGVGG